jgi:hypothetical protein
MIRDCRGRRVTAIQENIRRHDIDINSDIKERSP